MNYPYQKEFNHYCKHERHKADSTMLVVNRSLTVFWQYLDQSAINQVQASDIQNFLNSLETKLGLKENTINKYLSHIKQYYTFLYSHHLVDQYPIIEVNGRKFNRHRVYIINWMSHLPEIAQIKSIHPETIMMMLGIAQGYLPDEVLRLRYKTIIKKIESKSLRKYVKEHRNFDLSDNPYILGKKFGGYYPNDFHIAERCFPDRKLIGMPITLQSLRLSFVYSLLTRKDLTDQQLEQLLHANDKTLFYYRRNMQLYNELVEFKLPSTANN